MGSMIQPLITWASRSWVGVFSSAGMAPTSGGPRRRALSRPSDARPRLCDTDVISHRYRTCPVRVARAAGGVFKHEYGRTERAIASRHPRRHTRGDDCGGASAAGAASRGAAREGETMRVRHVVSVCVATLTILVAMPAVAGAVPPQYPERLGCPAQRSAPDAVLGGHARLLQGARGLRLRGGPEPGRPSTTPASPAFASLTAPSWIPGPTRPLPAPASCRRQRPATRPATSSSRSRPRPAPQDWAVLKFSRSGKQLWKRTYDSAQGLGHALRHGRRPPRQPSSSPAPASRPAATTAPWSSGAPPAGSSGSA